jgi:hypothetical protein
MLFRIFAFVVALALMAGLGWSQSLGDVARQQRGDGRKAKRVITDEDIPARSQPAQANGSAAASGSSSAVADAAEAKEAPAHPEAGAQAKDPESQATAKRVEELKNSEAVEKRIIEKLEKALGENPSEFRRGMLQESLENARKQLEMYTQERQELEQKLASGGPEKAPQPAK